MLAGIAAALWACYPGSASRPLVHRVELANAPTAEGRPAPFQIAATGSATVEGSTPSGTFAGKVVFDSGDDQAAPPPQPAPGNGWYGVIIAIAGALGLTGLGGGVTVWIARALAVARQVNAAREAFAEDMEAVAKAVDPEMVAEMKMRHKVEQTKRRIHTKVQKARGKA
jgi:hypothetical protein